MGSDLMLPGVGAAPPIHQAGTPARLRLVPLGTGAAAAVVAAFGGLQLLTVLLWANGPSLDEAIYITAGRRTLEGHGLDDRYLTWFAGSFAWPLLAAAGDALGGLDGARLIAAALVTMGLGCAVAATGLLLGARTRLAAAVLGATCGPILVLGHLAVYDALAFGFLGLALLFVVLAARRDSRVFVALAGLAFSGAVLAKYPVVLFGVPLACLLVVIRGPRGRADLILAGAVCSALMLIYVTPQRQQLSAFLDWRVENSPAFGVTYDIIAFEQLWLLLLPAVLALVGVFAAPPRRRALLLPLCAAIPLVPAYHFAAGDSVGATKHAAMAILIALPACASGLTAAAGLSRLRLLLFPVLAAWIVLGLIQVREYDRGWLDLRSATDFIAARAEPGDTVLANASWPFVMRLYDDGVIATPWSVYDRYRVEQGEAGTDLCRHTWFIDTVGETEWSPEVRQEFAACPGSRLVWAERQRLTTIGATGPFHYTAWIRVWRSAAR